MDKKEEVDLGLRNFIKSLAYMGGGALFLANSAPWLTSCTPERLEEIKKEKARLALIGSGSRGQYHIHNLLNIQHADLVAICDPYKTNLDAALALYPSAKGCKDYHEVLDDKSIDGVIIATPLHLHARITLDALASGKHVFCEKAMARTMEECKAVYDAYAKTDKALYYCMQRMYDEKYVKAMQMIKQGLIGDVVGMRCHWFRNADWRRPVPSPDLERWINWRLYKEYSGGLMTELGSHQLEVCNWAAGKIPSKIMGMGDIVFWKDGTMDLSKGVYYLENDNMVPGIRQLLDQIKNGVFASIPTAGPSWRPELRSEYVPHPVISGKTSVNGGQSMVSADHDGSDEILSAFCQSCITGEKAKNVVEEAYCSSTLCLLGNQAMEQHAVLQFPDEYKIPYMKF